MAIKENIKKLQQELSPNVTLVAVSKTKPESDLLEAYDSGVRDFGENKVQEIVRKQKNLPKDIQWHFIGHLQTNKVKLIAPFVHLIHGVDSFKLLNKINDEAVKNNRVISCLLQLGIAQEETKFGMSRDELFNLLKSAEFKLLNNIKIEGVMGMATYTENESIIRNEFKYLKTIFNELKNTYFSTQESFAIVSMGMSDDYKIAIEEGSTMVRIGSTIFGIRIYKND